MYNYSDYLNKLLATLLWIGNGGMEYGLRSVLVYLFYSPAGF